jgi:hypothetical protein
VSRAYGHCAQATVARRPLTAMIGP